MSLSVQIDPDGTCAIDNGDCSSYYAKGLCRTHYERNRIHGDPLAYHPKAQPKRDWIAAAIASTTDGCMIWPWSFGDRGYGQARIGGTMRKVHIYVCEQAHGPKPEGTEVAHSCRNKCCNARHLRWATSKENNADKVRDGTTNRGEQGPNAKLTWAKVDEIRRLSAGGATRAKLKEMFGVNVQYVIDGSTWKEEWRPT